jgi:hypothetical protein
MLPQELEDRNEVLFKKLVPGSGNCETREGETLRATNRICYRWFNDGDYWFEGYGCETAGPAEAFLRLHSPRPIRQKVCEILRASEDTREEKYEKCLENLVVTVVGYLEGRETLTPNALDMLDMESKYSDDDEDYYP